VCGYRCVGGCGRGGRGGCGREVGEYECGVRGEVGVGMCV